MGEVAIRGLLPSIQIILISIGTRLLVTVPMVQEIQCISSLLVIKQWGIAIVSSWNGVLDFTYPLAFSKSVLYAVTQEANPYSWRENQSATVTSAFYNQSLTSCQVVAKTITNGGNVLDTNSSTKVLIIGY